MSITTLSCSQLPLAEPYIQISKSDSFADGFQLRNAHYQLGKNLASTISNSLSDNSITIVILMRAGLCFGMGIADGLEVSGKNISVLFYYNMEQWAKEINNYSKISESPVILVDSVINTGTAILNLSNNMPCLETIFAANVVSEKSLPLFENRKLFAVRVSKHSFIGSKTKIIGNNRGPDTGDRLFNTF